MELIIILIFFVVIIGFLFISKNKSVRYQSNKDTFENAEYFEKVGPLFTNAEFKFLKVLQLIIKNPNIAIYGKVRIEDIIRVKRDTPNYIKQPLRNKIKSYHVDYVLLDKLNYSVICAIELQNSTHNKNYQIKRDKQKRIIFASAKIELIEIKCRAQYDLSDIKNKIPDDILMQII